MLAELLKDLPVEQDERILVGRETSDDAGVFLLNEYTALVQTVDFFTPMVNDPYDFGRIAAANALSDIYAMGATPLTAMNIVCFPTKKMDLSYLKEILRGGLDKIHEAGAVLIGGHSVEDDEIKYGLAVTGIIDPKKVLTNAGAQPGDAIVLTKPIGTGILATALKGKLISEDDMFEATEWMATLNKTASEIARNFTIHGCTDVTGFGLLGHLLEMAMASQVIIELRASSVPILPRAYDLASMGIIPAGSYANRNFCSHQLEINPSVDPVLIDLLTDPQTSGGLLLSLPQSEASELVANLKSKGLTTSAIIGYVLDKGRGKILVTP